MAITPHHGRRVAAALLALLGAACGDGPTTPDRGALQVLVQTTGGDLDVDGYEVVVDSQAPRRLPIRGTAQVGDLRPGTYTVALARVDANCTVSGTHPRSVTVVAGRTVDVSFDVACATTGIEIRTRTAGFSTPLGYQLEIVNSRARFITSNGSIVVSRLSPGPYTLGLGIANSHCSVAGGRRITVEVVNGAVTPVLFDVTCVVPVRPETIAYAADVRTNGLLTNQLAMVNPDGSGATELEPGNSPSWSGDGTRLVFSAAYCDFYYGCSDGFTVLDPETRLITSVLGVYGGFDPAWAPSGDRIAYSCCSTVPGTARLYVLRLDGAPSVEVKIPGVTQAREPAWAPDGERIAFTCVVEPFNDDVCTVKPDGTGLVRLTNGDLGESGPAWSPDGQRIAFATVSAARRWEVALMAPDGSAVTRLTDGSEPAWSRDGRKLVFAGRDGLFTINADGSNLTRLTTGNHRAPAWRP